MERVPEMGSRKDMSERQTLARVDGDDRRNKVLKARDLVYKKNYAVTSPHIQALLKDESLIPTQVGMGSNGLIMFMLTTAECLFRQTARFRPECICNAGGRSPARIRARGLESSSNSSSTHARQFERKQIV